MPRLSTVLFLVTLLAINSAQYTPETYDLTYSDYDLTYNDTSSCQGLCASDANICYIWVTPITGITTATCQDNVQNLCTDNCDSDPDDTTGCARCDDYTAAMCPSPNGQQYCDYAFNGCYNDCYCLEFCKTDYTFCTRYLQNLFAISECMQLIDAACYIPCRNGEELGSPQRQQMYMEYCYDTFTTKNNPGCEACLFPNYLYPGN